MTVDEIKRQLQTKRSSLDVNIKNEIRKLKAQAVSEGDETGANVLWCYETIFEVQNEYYNAYTNMQRAVGLSAELDEGGCDSPKSKAYETAWNELDRCDMKISDLETNFCISDSVFDNFYISEIKADIQRLFPLFPYRIFTSRETIIKREECSICGKTISVRNSCGHKVGKLYMGEICCRKVVDMEFLSINIVTKPFDRYAILKMQGQKFDFSLLDYIAPRIKPYMEWNYKIEKRLLPEYKRTGRNDRCPCGSGKKFKYCVRENEKKHYEDHYIFLI